VWTLSDEWLVSSSALHYAFDNGSTRRQRLVDVWVSFLKRAYFSRLFVIVKSERLASTARSSPLASRIYLAVMPNPIDVDFWGVGARREFRADDTVHVGFGYSGRQAGFRKGADFVGPLFSSLVGGSANKNSWRFKLSLFGDASIDTVPNIPAGTEVSALGALEPGALRELYKDLDFLLVPSRLDNTPNIVIEAMATGAIVVARQGSGAEDLLEGGRNGVVWAAGESVDQLAGRLLSLEPKQGAELQSLAVLKVRASCSEATYALKFARLLEGVLRPEVAEAHGWEVPCG
jgi:glycosyltransferase involved in cell wall biosynthesis